MKFLFAASTLIAIAAAQSLSSLSPCGQMCVNNMLGLAPSLGCASTDAKCLCSNAKFADGLRDCSLEACGAAVESSVVAFGTSYCSSAGVTLGGSGGATTAAGGSTGATVTATATATSTATESGGSAGGSGSATGSAASSAASALSSASSSASGALASASSSISGALSNATKSAGATGSGSSGGSGGSGSSTSSGFAARTGAPLAGAGIFGLAAVLLL